MQNIFPKVALLFALYVTVGCTATHVPVVFPPAEVVPASAPVVTTPSVPAPAPIQVLANAEPHIALLLPLRSASLMRAAEVVEQGFMAANKMQPNSLPIRIYTCADESKEIVALYQLALTNGAKAIVGPLTPAGVAALAAQPSIPVPTLALNRAEGKGADKLYFFGLALESEARQVASLAMAADLHIANIVSIDNPLSRRQVQAFSEEWKKLGGEIASQKIFAGDSDIFSDLSAEPGSMVFIAANANSARKFRPYLNAVLPVYSTSQIFNGNSNMLVNYDLRDVVFVDMPWLLQPDHPAVMAYPRAAPPLDTDLERLYALGIDSFRLLQIILGDRSRSALPLDGVTGIIRLGANHQFSRDATMAFFKQGLGLTQQTYAAMKAATKNGSVSKDNAGNPSGTSKVRE